VAQRRKGRAKCLEVQNEFSKYALIRLLNAYFAPCPDRRRPVAMPRFIPAGGAPALRLILSSIAGLIESAKADGENAGHPPRNRNVS
jgi:hypothetical protein